MSWGIRALRNLGLEADRDRNFKIFIHDKLNFFADLCKLQNRCALHGIIGDPFPALYIDDQDMGTLGNLKIQEIKALAQPSSFGLGNKLVFDENVRKASEIKGDRIKLDMPEFPYEIQNMAPQGYKIETKLHKLAIYEKDGFFSEHADSVHGDDHLGTLVLCLPVPHEGGTFILSDDGNELKLPFDEMTADGNIAWVAFYTDVRHQIEVVKSGTRVTLQFDLYVKKAYEQDDLGSFVEKAHGKTGLLCNFQDYNQEVLSSIKNKLEKVFSQKEQLDEENNAKKSQNKDLFEEKKMPEKDSDHEKSEMEIESESEDYYDKRKKKRKIPLNPDGSAIMLKRRYAAASLSLDKLKGSDNALYHFLKDHFVVDVRPIILEQETYPNDDCEPELGEIEVIALYNIRAVKDVYTSDEEVESNQNSYEDNSSRNEEIQTISDNSFTKKEKNIWLVSGFTTKTLFKLVSEEYNENAGNEPQSGFYSYLHAALFIYPKELQKN